MSKKKFVQWLVSTWIIQVFMRLVASGWCFVRKNDRRFVGVSDALSYEGDATVVAKKHRPNNWNVWVCVRIPTSYYGPVRIAFDVYTGQRLVLLGKEFQGWTRECRSATPVR